MFKRRPSWQEYQILAGDDKKLSHTREYIYPLIEQAIKKVDDTYERQRITKQLRRDVSLAVERFIRNINNARKDMSFASYFTWYIHQRIAHKSIYIRKKKIGETGWTPPGWEKEEWQDTFKNLWRLTKREVKDLADKLGTRFVAPRDQRTATKEDFILLIDDGVDKKKLKKELGDILKKKKGSL
ncbi:MAG: hypothetical protein KBC26_02105 [Candidatus Pacebacteria bacterium]|nr:hypothetical protein [Candidatus Paceibacterota bacterium]